MMSAPRCLPAECAFETAMKHHSTGATLLWPAGWQHRHDANQLAPPFIQGVGVGTMKSGGKGAIPAVAEAVHWNVFPQCAR